MNTEHLSEQEIQQYALDNDSCEKKIRQHVGVCQYCREKIQNYQLLFTAIKAQPPAAFNFNLADSVLEKLPQPKKSFDLFFDSIILWLAILCMSLVIYLFRSHLLYLFSNIALFSICLIITGQLTVLAFLCIENYITFLKKMKKLNYH
jgi:hypothetical protein